MKLNDCFVTKIHSEKKNKDYLKGVLICYDEKEEKTKVYSFFGQYTEDIETLLTSEANLDIIDINYKCAMLLYGDNKLILDRIF